MGWVKVHDGFTDHPKIDKAGEDAGWLYLCGLTYCSRYLTDGRIPGERIPMLTKKKNPQRLAAALVDVGLWERDGRDFVVHDYLDWQQSSTRILAERDAARARRKPERRANVGRTSGDEPANVDEASGDVLPQRSKKLEVEKASSSALTDNSRADPPNLEEEALRILAERRLNGTSTNINNRPAYIAKVQVSLRKDLADQLATAPSGFATAQQLADWLEPRPTPPPMTDIGRTAAAARAVMARNDSPPCPTCNGTRWTETDIGDSVNPCPTCQPIPAEART